MGMKRNKKAILFSLISALFSILFITLFSQSFLLQEERMPGSNIRIKVMDVYARNFEKYVGDSIELATYKALDGMTLRQDALPLGTFFADSGEFNRSFYNCMICGYVNCSLKNSANNCSLGNNDLNSSINNITQLSLEQMNIKTEYVINSIEISQTYPFEVEVAVNISFNITDASAGETYAVWSKEKVINQSVQIIGLLDPAGKISDMEYSRRIKKYSGPCEFNQSCWNDVNTASFYQSESFRYSGNSTSFLQRYWNGNVKSVCCGIETILHPGELTPLEEDNSYIDQYYWSGENSCAGYMILNITLGGEEVHLDEFTATRYGVVASGRPHCLP